jgi:hypothetical protein
MNKQLAQIVKRAFEIREQSWDEAGNKDWGVYRVSLDDACDQAAEELGNKAVGRFVFLALYSWPNNAFAWADEQLK